MGQSLLSHNYILSQKEGTCKFLFYDKSVYDKEEIETIEEDKKDYVKYVWKSIDELSKCDFRPKILLDIIKKDEFTHYINVDESAKTLKREKNQ